MVWNVVEENTEIIEDTNPDIWLRSSEESLKNSNIDEALYKIDKAIYYSNENTHYVFEKVKVLYSSGRYDECLEIINSKIQDFQRDFKGNNKLNNLFEYYSEIINLNSQGGQKLLDALIILYNNEMHEEFLDLIEKKFDILRNTVDSSAFNNLIDKFLKALMNIKNKDYNYYLNKSILLYKLGFYEQFLSFILDKLSNNFSSINKSVLKILLNYVDNALNYTDNKKKYYFIKIKLLFYCDMYDECANEICYNIDNFDYNQISYVVNYLKDCFMNNSKNDINLFRKTLVLFNIDKFETFLEVIKIKIESFRYNLSKEQFDELLDYVYKAILKNKNMTGKKIHDYASILYKYNKIEQFIDILETKKDFYALAVVENNIATYKKELNNDQWDKLLNCFYENILSNSQMNSLNVNAAYNKIKFFFNYGRYDQFLALLYYKNNYNFVDLIYQDIQIYKNKFSDEQFERILEYVCKKIKDSNEDSTILYKRIKEFFEYIGFERMLNLFKYKNYNFDLYIKEDIEFYEENLDEEPFDKLLAYFYNTTKSFVSGNSGYKFDCIKMLYNYGKFNECIELFKDNINLFLKEFDYKEHKEAIRYFRRCYFKGGRILSGLAFCITSPIRYRTKRAMYIQIALLLVILAGYKFNVLYNIGILDPEIVGVEIIPNKEIMDKNESVYCEIKVNTKPENVRNVNIELTSANPNIIKVEKEERFQWLLDPVEYGKGKLVVTVSGKNSKKTQKEIQVKKAVVSEIYLKSDKTKFEIGEDGKVSAELKMNYNRAVQPTVKYLSSNTEVISVDDSGNIRTLSGGEAVITARAGNKETSIYMKVNDSYKSSYEGNNNYNRYNSDDVFPKSSFGKLTGRDLYDLNIETLWIGRNEIFARYGYIFTNRRLQQYFENKSWYYPNSKVTGSLDELNEIERDNVRLIKQIEEIKMAYEEYGYDINMDYILPNSSSQQLSLQEIEGLSLWELVIARNEIFARHGFVFGVPELKNYFDSKSWYQPNSSYNGNVQNAIEEYNVSLIKQVEEQKLEEMIKRYYGE